MSRSPACSTSGSPSSRARAESARRPSPTRSASRRRRAGKRTIVCEIAAQERGAELFGATPHRLQRDRAWRRTSGRSRSTPTGWSASTSRCCSRSGRWRRLLYRSNIFTYLAAATPGLQEVVSIGKAYELTLDVRRAPGDGRVYDLVIVDAPATGHGIGFLEAPGTFRRIARGGPLADQASRIERMITDESKSGRRHRRHRRGDGGQRVGRPRGRPRGGRRRRSTSSSSTGSSPSASRRAELDEIRAGPRAARRRAGARCRVAEAERARHAADRARAAADGRSPDSPSTSCRSSSPPRSARPSSASSPGR